jgi:hypothetical protein
MRIIAHWMCADQTHNRSEPDRKIPTVANTLPVIPAKAGIQGAEIGAPALGPRFREGDDKWLMISAS